MQHIILIVERYGLLAVFLNVLAAESGLPLPAYPMLITASALAVASSNQVAEIVLVGISAALIADLGWYWSGRRYGRRVLALLCKISLSPDSCVRQTQSVFAKVGPASLLFAKFIPGLSNITVALASISNVGLLTFLALDAIGALLFVGVPVLLGQIFKDAIDDTLETLASFGKWGILGIAAALGIFLLGKWWQRHRFIHKLRMDRITIAELHDLIAAGLKPLILDVRPKEMRQRDGIIPGAVAAHPSEIAEIESRYARDREIIVYCSCPNEVSAAMAAKHLKRAGFKKIRPLLGGIDAWALAGHPIEAVRDIQPALELVLAH